jgi:hypothetical protein
MSSGFCHSGDHNDNNKTIENVKKSHNYWQWMMWASRRKEKLTNMNLEEFYRYEMSWINNTIEFAKIQAAKKNRIIYPALVISSLINGILLEKLLNVSKFFCKRKKKSTKSDCEDNKYITR